MVTRPRGCIDQSKPLQHRALPNTADRDTKSADIQVDTHKQYLDNPTDALHKACLEILEKRITKVFVFRLYEQSESLFQNNPNHTEAHVNKRCVRDRTCGMTVAPTL